MKQISTNSPFEEKVGYSRAIVDESYVFVSGTTGFDYETMMISDDVVEQTEQCFRTIQKVLEEAGSDLSRIVRVQYILPKREDFEPCWPILRKYLGTVKPASTMIVAGLADERMRIEIEVTAKL